MPNYLTRKNMKEVVKKLLYGPLAPIASILFQCISNIEYWYFEQKRGIGVRYTKVELKVS